LQYLDVPFQLHNEEYIEQSVYIVCGCPPPPLLPLSVERCNICKPVHCESGGSAHVRTCIAFCCKSLLHTAFVAGINIFSEIIALGALVQRSYRNFFFNTKFVYSEVVYFIIFKSSVLLSVRQEFVKFGCSFVLRRIILDMRRQRRHPRNSLHYIVYRPFANAIFNRNFYSCWR